MQLLQVTAAVVAAVNHTHIAEPGVVPALGIVAEQVVVAVVEKAAELAAVETVAFAAGQVVGQERELQRYRADHMIVLGLVVPVIWHKGCELSVRFLLGRQKLN